MLPSVKTHKASGHSFSNDEQIPVVSLISHVITLTAESTSVKLCLVRYISDAVLLWTIMEIYLLIWCFTASGSVTVQS